MDAQNMISVVIPTYNRAELIGQAVRSVLNQTYRNLELHLVDDGSTDETRSVCAEFQADRRFHYHYQHNQGQSAARNLGIAHAQGELVAFLDSDNFWLPQKLELQLEYLSRNPSFDILYSDISVVDANGQKFITASSNKPSGIITSKLIQGNFITNNTVLVQKRCFYEMGGFDEKLRHAEDYDLWLRFSTRFRFLHHPYVVTFYRAEGDRLSAQEGKVLVANRNILTQFFTKYPTAVGTFDRRSAWSNYYRWRARAANRGVPGKPWRDLLRAFGLAPLDSRNWRTLIRHLIG